MTETAAIMGRSLVIIGGEVSKGVRVLWAYPAAIVLQVATSLAIYLGMQFIIGQGRFAGDLLPPTLVAMTVFIFLFIASLAMVADLMEEMRTGTLEQAHLSPLPQSVLVLGRLGSASLQGVGVAVIAAAVPMLLLHVAIPVRWEALVPFVLTLLNGLAFTLLFTGIALRVPFIGEIHHLATGVIGLFNGMYVPVAMFPDWLQTVVAVVPTTVGIRTTLAILFQHRSLAEVWADGSLPALVAYTVALLALGWLVFVRNDRRAMRAGALGQY